MMPSSTTPASKLRAFVTRFAKRPDVRVTTLALGDPAPPDVLDTLRGKIPSELLAFYREMNGAHVEWVFVEPPGGGCIEIPRVSDWTRFASDDELRTDFGNGVRAMLLDVLQAECATWYLLAEGKSPDEAVLWFKGSGHHKVAAPSLDAYIDAAIDHGFAAWWPVNGFPDVVERVRAKPKKPATLAVGTRVETNYYSEGARGVIEALATIAGDPPRSAEYLGTSFARVTLDDGPVKWIPTQWLKAVKGVDEYEDARARGMAYWSELTAQPVPARLEALAYAIGPLQGYSPTWGGPSNARRACGMLSTLPLDVAVDAVATAFADAGRLTKGGVPLREERVLAKSKRAFGGGGEWRSRDHRFVPAEMLEGLIAGLARRFERLSAANGVAPSAMAADASARLRAITGFATYLAPVLARETPFEATVLPDEERRLRDELGLDASAGLATGTGF